MSRCLQFEPTEEDNWWMSEHKFDVVAIIIP